MVDVVHEPIDDVQAELHIWPPADFCGFGLEHTVPIYPILNFAYGMQMLQDGGMVTVHHICQFFSTLFKQSSSNPKDFPERGMSLISQRSSY